MKQILCGRVAIAVLAFAFPIAALADVSGTQVFQAGTALNLDTGATASSGGDVLWDGNNLIPQGKATVANIAALGPIGFAIESESVLKGLKVIASAAPIPASKLPVNQLLGVYTNGGNIAKALVTANSGGSLTLQFLTFIAAIPTGPTITAVQNNSSRIPAGLPNYGITPSSIFVIVGTGLADSGDPVLQSSAPPGLQTTLNGASIAVTVNNVTVHPPIYYTSPAQIAAVLPASTPLGAGTLTVTYKGTVSAPAAIQVVASALGINTYYTNSGVATDAISGALLTYTNSGTPGEAIVLWTTGLGADPSDSDTTYTTTPHSVNTPLQIYVGNVLATILYQGSAGYPGVNQINVLIPDSAPSGCWVSLAVIAGGVVSNIATLPINKGGGACVDAQTGLNGNQIAPSGGQTLRTGLAAVIQTNSRNASNVLTVTNSSDAAFEKYTGIYTPNNSVSPGGCIVDYLMPATVGTITGLDVGAISLSGPAGLSTTLGPQFDIKGAFYAALADGAIPSSGGTFTFKGSGGADVGSFTSTVTFTNPLLTWTNTSVAATIDRTKDLQVTWTGGNPGTYVFVTGGSTSAATSNSPAVTLGYTCLASADAGKFTVPSYILSALPAGKGGMGMQNDVYSTLTASGLDIGLALGDISFSVASTYK